MAAETGEAEKSESSEKKRKIARPKNDNAIISKRTINQVFCQNGRLDLEGNFSSCTILVGFWADEGDGEIEEEGEGEEEELEVFLLVRDWGCWPEGATVISFSTAGDFSGEMGREVLRVQKSEFVNAE